MERSEHKLYARTYPPFFHSERMKGGLIRTYNLWSTQCDISYVLIEYADDCEGNS